MKYRHLLLAGSVLLMLTACGGSDSNKRNSSSSSAPSSMVASVSSGVASSEVASSSAISSTATSSDAGTSSAADSSSSSSTSSTDAGQNLQGTAAVGNPIANGTVVAKCADGSGFTTAVTTNTQGAFSGVVTTGALPCVLQVSGGAPNVVLHSYTLSSGIVNITPLTDLALALAIKAADGSALADWFAAPTNWSAISGGLVTALDSLRSALVTAGYELPEAWVVGSTAPFTAAFTPNPATDAFDQLLESLAQAIESSGSYADYEALLAAFVGGGAFPQAPGTGPVNPTPPTGPVTFTPFDFTEDSSDSDFLNAISGAHDVNVYNGPTGHRGPATLTVSYDGTRITQSLTLKAGNLLLFSANPLADKTGERSGGLELRWIDKTSKYPFAPAGGKDVNIWHYYNEGAAGQTGLRTAWLPSGRIMGEMSSNYAAFYQFTNEYIYADAAVPELLESIAGTWVGQQRICHDAGNPLTVTVVEGTVTVGGTDWIPGFPGSCKAFNEIAYVWDGVNDTITWRGPGAPAGTGSQNGPDPALTYSGEDQKGVWYVVIDNVLKLHISTEDRDDRLLWINIQARTIDNEQGGRPPLVLQP